MPDETSYPEENLDEGQEPSEREAEPRGGPAKRVQEFLDERFATLRPKEAAGEGEPEPCPPHIPLERGLEAPEPGEEAEEGLPDDYRLTLIEQYRQRQEEQLEEEGRAPPPSPREPPTREGRAPPPPLPPTPPPANNWIPIGPSVLRQGQGGVKPATSGRVPGIAVAPGGARVYIGAANGGVWRSKDTGQTWEPLMEAFDLNPTHAASDSLACGAIALVPGATPEQDRVYVGSGEGSGAAYFGVGPVVSFDGGADWNTEPVSPGSPQLAGSGFYALAVDPADADRVVAATRRGLYRREPDGSGGFHWAQKTMGGSTTQRVTSVFVARSAATTTFYAARQGGPVYSSNDGHTWTQAGSGFPGSGFGRVSLALQENNPGVVYAFLSNGNVYRLATSDGTWRKVSGLPSGSRLLRSQGWYDLSVAVAPDNANRIYLGGSTVHSGGDWSGALYRCEIAVSGSSVSASPTYIGNSIHADVHAIVFAPGDPGKMWVGCDGGVFTATDPTGTGDIFQSRNIGLSTMTMNHLDQHPTEDAVVFCGTQDNGGQRFTGEEAWLYSAGGDCGYFVVNWDDPYKLLNTYVNGSVRRSTDGGSRYSYGSVNVPLAPGESVRFYAPLVGTPYNPDSLNPSAEAAIVAFGSIRPWISTTFGGGWQSIPSGTLAGDSLNGAIRSLVFASATRLYAGTMRGGVYRFDKSGTTWSRIRIDTLGSPNDLPIAGPVTDIAVDPADANGNSIYITFGGTGDYRHVWHFDGSQWQQRSGPAAAPAQKLLDVQHSAIVVDPVHTSHVYAGADIGIWHSTDGGVTWATFSHGLPDVAVMDLKIHNPRRLLRASTHGRGVYERTLEPGLKQGVELYVRDTQLDQGRFSTVNGLPDPTKKGEQVQHWRGPDIKCDTPDAAGTYQFPLTGTIDFLQFVDVLSDDFRNVATHATATITTRVYVQVHNRGVVPADGVRVMLLLANASAGLPALPAGYEADVQTGTPINTAHWQTVGIETLNDVRVGAPKIAAFNLTSDKLPPPANLAGNNHHCVLALVHHVDDPYTSSETHTDTNSKDERKAAHKNLSVVQFTGTLPAPEGEGFQLKLWSSKWLWGYTIIRARLHNAAGQSMTPIDGAAVTLALRRPNAPPESLGEMRWHRSWRSFFYFLRGAPAGANVVAAGCIKDTQVAEAETDL